MSDGSWLTVRRGEAPLLVSIPHTGTEFAGLEDRLVSPWMGRRDTDWHIEKLYAFAEELDATVVRTAISRTVIDVNRDPSGQSLYPGQATTGLCPLESFDGDALYKSGEEPDAAEIEDRKKRYFQPYHDAIQAELDRLRKLHGHVVIYDCHSIRSLIPRLFEGELPIFNLGTNGGESADPVLQKAVTDILEASGCSHVVNGRFKGGWITRHYGRPADGVHALQMELACRGYIHEPVGPVDETNWPVAYDPAYAAPLAAILREILETALAKAPALAGARA
jgi:N-formylglutamate deformylase